MGRPQCGRDDGIRSSIAQSADSPSSLVGGLMLAMSTTPGRSAFSWLFCATLDTETNWTLFQYFVVSVVVEHI